MKWNPKHGRDTRVKQSARWMYLSNYKNLQNRAGVYIFANSAYQVKYIGKAGAGRIVQEIGNAIWRNKNKGATLVKVLYTNSGRLAQTLETELIRIYNPVNNETIKT